MRTLTIIVSLLLLSSCGNSVKIVGSCKSSDQFCSDYTGPQWTAADVQTTCDASQFSLDGCPLQGLSASCRINEGQPGERILHMYGVDETTARDTCIRLGGGLSLIGGER